MARARVSRATGLNIVMGSGGYYIEPFQPAGWTDTDEDQMVGEIVEDVRRGVGDTGIRAGIIGSWGVRGRGRRRNGGLLGRGLGRR